jgi:hypothetical protein
MTIGHHRQDNRDMIEPNLSCMQGQHFPMKIIQAMSMFGCWGRSTRAEKYFEVSASTPTMRGCTSTGF